MRMTLGVMGLVAVSGMALGQTNGSLLVTDSNNDRILQLNQDGTTTTLVDFTTLGFGNVRLAEFEFGPNGKWYVTSGANAGQLDAINAIFEIDNLFGTPTVRILDQGALTGGTTANPLQNPIAIEWDAQSQQLLTINNPGGPNVFVPEFNGVFGTTLAGQTTIRFQEPANAPTLPRPTYINGADMTRDRFSTDFFIAAVDGGVESRTRPPASVQSSVIWRYNTSNDTPEILVDLARVNTGLPEIISFVQGIAQGPGNTLFITDAVNNAVYRINLDSNGDFASIVQIVSGFDTFNPATGFAGGGDIVYNQFTGKLNFIGANDDEIWEVNTDGTGLRLLASGINARGLFVIPTPGVAAVAGLGALVATRRRR